MTDGLDDLEKAAADRRRRGRSPGRSKNPRDRKQEDRKQQELADREKERRRRQEEEERRRRQEEEEERRQRQEEEERSRAEDQQLPPGGGEETPPPPPPGPPEGTATPSANSDEGGIPSRGKRPASIPFYYDPDNEEFLWRITLAAVDRREKIPASAVLRLAMRRLEDQMTPDRIVQELGGPTQSSGKRGRPRK